LEVGKREIRQLLGDGVRRWIGPVGGGLGSRGERDSMQSGSLGTHMPIDEESRTGGSDENGCGRQRPQCQTPAARHGGGARAARVRAAKASAFMYPTTRYWLRS
jgi:hypothetical protein